MRRIDMHTHILPRKIPKFAEKFGYGDFIHLEDCDCGANMVKPDGKVFRQIKPNCYDKSARIIDMDKTHVDIQVLSTVPIMFSYFAKPQDGLEVARFLNDDIAQTIDEGEKRFLGLGTLPLQDPDLAIKEMQRCKNELGLSGIELGTHIEGKSLGHEDFIDFFAEAEKLEMSLFVHPWQMMGQSRMPEYWLPWLVGMPAESSFAICSLIFSGVLERHPNLKIAFAHGGGSFAGTIGRIDHGFNVRPDLCAKDNNKLPSSYLGKFYVDSLTHDEKALLNLVELFGEDKILMGSDYPFPLGEHEPGRLIEENQKLKNEQKKKLLFENALEWLGTTEKHIFGE